MILIFIFFYFFANHIKIVKSELLVFIMFKKNFFTLMRLEIETFYQITIQLLLLWY